MLSLAPWYYRNLYNNKEIISEIINYKYTNLFDENLVEVLVKLNKNLIPNWAHESTIYSHSDGSGTSQFLNIAIHKALSESLERWAFYETIDINPNTYAFDENPSTTGMAAYPSITISQARNKAILEATERWALHEFWRGNLPLKIHKTSIQGLKHYEIMTTVKNIKISLLSYENDGQYFYSFAAEEFLNKSFLHALNELSRNIRVLKKIKSPNSSINQFSDISDKRLYFFSGKEGYNFFLQKVENAASSILANPIVICDKEIIGKWTEYAKVWRFLYKGSFPNDDNDHTFFMF